MKYSLAQAIEEKLEDDAILCRTCTSPADPEHEPHCMSCGLYWQDCANGLWADNLMENTVADKDTSNPSIVWVEHLQAYRIGRNYLEVGFHKETGQLIINDRGSEEGIVYLSPYEAMLLASLITSYYAEHMEFKQ